MGRWLSHSPPHFYIRLHTGSSLTLSLVFGSRWLSKDAHDPGSSSVSTMNFTATLKHLVKILFKNPNATFFIILTNLLLIAMQALYRRMSGFYFFFLCLFPRICRNVYTLSLLQAVSLHMKWAIWSWYLYNLHPWLWVSRKSFIINRSHNWRESD